MNAGRAIFDLAEASGARSLFIVGTAKNVGKTVTARALYEAAVARDIRVGIASVGRDGEAVDVADGAPKPRLFLHPGTLLATARDVLPRSPAVEYVEDSSLQTASGRLVYARVVRAAHYELVGPPSASGVREAVATLAARCDTVVVDGAIDRVAALAGMPGAIVVAAGASAGSTTEEAVEAIRALVQRLTVEIADPTQPAIEIEGALTPALAAELVETREQRQVVVRDPTQIALTGRAAIHDFARLRIRCRRPLRVIAATVASIGRDRSFEPRAFARAVASATGLPTFDVYAGERAA
jgi:hypothetical protein